VQFRIRVAVAAVVLALTGAIALAEPTKPPFRVLERKESPPRPSSDFWNPRNQRRSEFWARKRDFWARQQRVALRRGLRDDDGDGIQNRTDVDDDNDGVSDALERDEPEERDEF
jgi:hypothetical protein